MYQNAGRTIKKVVSIVVKIGYGFSILAAAAILIGCLATGETEFVIFGMFGALVVGGLGCLGAWLSGLWLYAYGEITDCLISIDARLADWGESEDREDVSLFDEGSKQSFTHAQYCSQCGARNDANSLFCSTCGNALI